MHLGHNGHVTEITSDPGDWRSCADRHAPRASLHPADRPVPDYYYPPDELDEFCIACTPESGPDGWQHDGGCPLRSGRTA